MSLWYTSLFNEAPNLTWTLKLVGNAFYEEIKNNLELASLIYDFKAFTMYLEHINITKAGPINENRVYMAVINVFIK